MAVVIIIGGSGRAKQAIENANQDASAHNWTQAQKDALAQKFNDFADAVDHDRNEYNKANP